VLIMLSNLLLYRFALLNGLAASIAIALWSTGHVLPVFETDQSRLTVAIAALFAIGWLWSWKEAVAMSRALNASKLDGVRPASEAVRDKALAKTEWLASVSEWLVGMGLLGTVVGFSIALSGIDQGAISNANGAQSAVTALMQGMRVALNTTLLGASLALWHEVNIRMLRTALATYWADRVAAWQMRVPTPARRPLPVSALHGTGAGLAGEGATVNGEPLHPCVAGREMELEQ
jgi:hypothetical protein